MARTKQTLAKKNIRGGAAAPVKGGAQRRAGGNYRSQREEMELVAMMKQKAERRDRIIAKQRRVAAKWQPKIPEARKVNFDNFKNRYQPIDEPAYAIEALVGGTGLQAQIRREHGRRRREELIRLRESYMKDKMGPMPLPKVPTYSESKRDKKAEASALAADGEVQRIRVQSQPILGHLTTKNRPPLYAATRRDGIVLFSAVDTGGSTYAWLAEGYSISMGLPPFPASKSNALSPLPFKLSARVLCHVRSNPILSHRSQRWQQPRLSSSKSSVPAPAQ
jgi:hypothetical protein